MTCQFNIYNYFLLSATFCFYDNSRTLDFDKERENVLINSKRKAFHTLLQNNVILVMSSHLQTLSSVVNRELKHGRRS